MTALSDSAALACARALRESILTGALPPGVRLPTERSLAEQFGVNRGTVRSALARLESEHLVSVRQGSGYTVHDFRREAGPDLLAPLVDLAEGRGEEAIIAKDLLLVRRSLARAVLERVVEHKDPVALDAVAAALERFRELAVAKKKVPAADLARADLDVVAALVAATGSTVLMLCLNPVAALVARMPGLQEAMYQDALDNVAAYGAVLAWARAGRRTGIEALLGALEARDAATLAHLAAKGKARRSR